MKHIFDIDKSSIKAVDDETARELVARLCRAEMRFQGLPESAVTWGGDQRAKDGGVDVRVDCPSPLKRPNFVKTACTAFQVKAEKFPASKIQKEMAPKGIIRPALIELKETGGTYIIASTKDDFADSALQSRRDAVLKCLSDHGLGKSVQYDFYDSRRIADWVEQHPPIATWLRHKIGRPLKGWRPYAPWAYDEEDPEAEYLTDDQVKVFLPSAEEGSDINQAIAQLRKELEHTVSIRIVGLSGVGKTRLVQALFDQRVCAESLAPTFEKVIYVDLADEPEPQPTMMLESLLEHESDSIVVIDNCGPDTHEKLTSIVHRKHSRLRLITVEYDIRDNLPEDTLCYRLEGSSPELITKLLKARYQHLSDSDADRIAEFSDGNARVAFALASTVEKGGELSLLRNQELFERIFQQKNEPNDKLLRCAEAASLLYSFDGSDVSPNGEIERLASFAEVTPLTFCRDMAELERRGLLQKRGRWRAVLPHAIANGLAKRTLQFLPGDLLYDSLIEQGGERVARSFSRRLGFLHDCPEAVAIASQMVAKNGRLGDLTKLSDFEQQMFVNLAPVDPRGALNAIARAMEKDEFLSTENQGRTQFARVVRSIAYEPEYFDDAALILRKFTLAEPEDYRHEPARDILKSLFFCSLSGTQASFEQRRKVVEGLVSSSDEKECGLGFDLLSAGLKTSHFSSSYGFEFGARRRDYGWYPQSQADVKNWFRPWIEIAATIGAQDNADGRKARTILGESFRGLWKHVDLYDELVDIAKRVSAIDGWPEGWLGVRRVLQWDMESLSTVSLTQLKKLEKTLAPSDLASEIRARILARGIFAYDLDEEEEIESENRAKLSPSEKFHRTQTNAETLGTRSASSPELLETIIPDLCSTEPGGGVFFFGRGVGRCHADVAGLLEAVRTHIERSGGNRFSLIWVQGLLSGWSDTGPGATEVFLDKAVSDVVWRDWFVELQTRVALNERGFHRLLRALEDGQCPTRQFAYLAIGRVTDHLTVSQIISIAKKLILRPDRGLLTAIDLLAMVIHCTDEKDENYKRELGKELIEFICCVEWSVLDVYNENIEYDINVILEFLLQSAESKEKVAPIISRILPTDENGWEPYRNVRKVALIPFFKYFPNLSLEMVCAEEDDGTLQHATKLLSNRNSERNETAIGYVPKEVLIIWCNKNPDIRYVFAATTCKLFEIKGDDKTPFAISDTAVGLLAEAPDKNAIVSIFIRRFQPSVWSGSLADILEARLPLLDQLADSPDEAVRSELASAKDDFQKWTYREREREREREMSRNSSFE